MLDAVTCLEAANVAAENSLCAMGPDGHVGQLPTFR